MEKIKIQPVLVGGDINCYSVARAYHEAYGVKSIAFGKMLLGATKDSNIIDFRVDPNMGNKEEKNNPQVEALQTKEKTKNLLFLKNYYSIIKLSFIGGNK